MVWQAIIPAVASIAGQVGSKLLEKKPKAQPLPQRVTPIQLRDEAFVAGFNPLTVLGASAGGGFGFNNPTHQAIPGLSSLDVIGQALNSGLQTFAQRYDPIGDQTRRLENDLLKKQIEAADRAAANSRVPEVRPLGNRHVPSVMSLDGTVETYRPRALGVPRPPPLKAEETPGIGDAGPTLERWGGGLDDLRARPKPPSVDPERNFDRMGREIKFVETQWGRLPVLEPFLVNDPTTDRMGMVWEGFEGAEEMATLVYALAGNQPERASRQGKRTPRKSQPQAKRLGGGLRGPVKRDGKGKPTRRVPGPPDIGVPTRRY